MAYTETKTTGYGSRITGSLKGIIFGLFLLVGATALLWYNEGRAVRTAKDIKEVGHSAVHVETIETPAPDGQTIHANGVAQTNDTLRDNDFGITVKALALERKVEYYQWVERSRKTTRDKIGGGEEEVTTYDYTCEWVSKPVNSREFHDPEYRHSNRVLASVAIQSQTLYASKVRFGTYTMPENFIPSVALCAEEENTPLDINPEILDKLDKDVRYALLEPEKIISMKFSSTDPWVHVLENQIYLGRNAASPNVGDMRITFNHRKPSAIISLVAVVKGNSFTDYKTKNNNERRYITSGTKSLNEMMQSANDDNKMWTWGLRLLGIIMACIAFRMIFQLIVTLMKVLPIVANILEWGIAIVCSVLGMAYSLFIIALAWIFYHPLFGACLLALSGGVAAAFIYWGAAKRKALEKTPNN